MPDSPLAFGTDGVRGPVPDSFNLGVITRIGRGVCSWLNQAGADGTLRLPGVPESMAKPFAQRLLVGYDRRPDSADFAAHLTKVCRAYGFQVDTTPSYAPTPALAYATLAEGYDCALIITASHNGYTDNGLKLKPHYGGSATGEITSAVERAMADPATAAACATVKSTVETLFDPFPNYAAKLRELIPFRDDALQGVTIQFDPMHGATTHWLPRILEGTGLVVNQLHADLPTHQTSLHPEPLAQWLTTLTEAVLSTPGSVGIACDGDGDRLGLIDEQGRFLSSQLFYPLILLSRLKLDDLPVRAIAKTFSGTMLLNRIATAHGLTLHEVPVGYKHISLMLAAGEIAMGGEESGGLGYVEFIPERDGQLSGLMTLALMDRRGMRLCELLDELQAEFGPVVFERKDLRLARVVSRSELKQVLAEATKSGSFAGHPVVRTEDIDGVKLWFHNGWLLFRPSGTEPVLRIYCELDSAPAVQQTLHAAIALVQAAGGWIAV